MSADSIQEEAEEKSLVLSDSAFVEMKRMVSPPSAEPRELPWS